MRVDLVSTGEEVLRGEIVDTNAAHAASLLTDHGFDVGRHHTCGDDLLDLSAVLRLALQEADAVVSCGGLGPTLDDRTAEAAAAVLGVELQTDAAVLEDLKRKFETVGLPFTASQERQARKPAGASHIDNPNGTAPGIEARSGNHLLFCLPGPPREFRPMLEGYVLDHLLEERSQREDETVTTVRVLRVFGKGEGWVADALGNLEDDVAGLTLGFQAASPEILLKLRASARQREACELVLDAGEQLARERLGRLVYATGDSSLAATVIDLLADRGQTLAVAESCTGGLTGSLLTDVPGSSRVFVLSAVTYANGMKERVLGVPHEVLTSNGAVSEACARAMAEGVRKVSGADLSVAVTGVAGPDGGTAEKPVGTIHLAVSDDRGTDARQRMFGFRDRAFVRRLSAFAALELVRRRLLGEEPIR